MHTCSNLRSVMPVSFSDFLTRLWNKRGPFRKGEARSVQHLESISQKKPRPSGYVSCWAEINMTSFNKTLFCLEIHKQEGNEWPVALIAKSFGAREAAALRNASQRDERIVQQLHMVCQRKRSLCCLEKIRTEDRTQSVALVRGKWLQSLVAGNYEPWKQPWAASTPASHCRHALVDDLNVMLK